MAFLKKLFGKKEKPHEVNLEAFARLPVFNMGEGGAPFNDWKDPDVVIPPNLESLFKVSVWVYQVYIFNMIANDRYGEEIEKRIYAIQLSFLAKIYSEEHAANFDAGMNLIKRSLHRQHEKPVETELNGEKIKLPMDWGLAMEILLFTKDSPYLVKEGESAPDFEDNDTNLALCLEHGKRSAINYFKGGLNEITVTL
jgi:hypothetical protein